jgi:hypothetical protein
VADPPIVLVGVVTGSLALAVSAARSTTTCLVLLARPTLAATRRTEAEEPEASSFFRSHWRVSHCSSVKRSLPSMVIGSEGGSYS